jgi:Phage integrase family
MQNDERSTGTAPKRLPWNKGKLIGPKPPLRPKHVWSIRTKLQLEGRIRDLAMFNLAHRQQTARLRCGQPESGRRCSARDCCGPCDGPSKEDGPACQVRVTEQTSEAVDHYVRATGKRPGQFLFTGRGSGDRAISTRQYARLVSRWIASIGLNASFFGTHSLRRTKATLIYRRTGNLRAVQLLLGHSKIESTVRYLGIEVDDALAIAEQVDV